MTGRNHTLWEQGASCLTMLVLAITNAPFMPRSIRRPLSLFLILVLIFVWFIDRQKRAGYSEGELERERRDERNRMIRTQAVWYCHVAEDWILLGLFVIFGLYVQSDVIAYTMMWVLVARNLLSFGIRWWLNRKY